MACKPTAYVYMADIHCVPCTLQAFGSDHHGHAAPDATDQEGNPLGVVCGRISSDGFDSLQVCGTCGSFLCPHCGAVAEDDPGHGPDDFCWNCRSCRYCGGFGNHFKIGGLIPCPLTDDDEEGES